jgi:hypothetical protein
MLWSATNPFVAVIGDHDAWDTKDTSGAWHFTNRIARPAKATRRTSRQTVYPEA